MMETTYQVSSTPCWMDGPEFSAIDQFCSRFKNIKRSINHWLLMIVPSLGSPLQFFVDAVNSGVVTAYGPGLSYGMVNKAATFTVVTKNAGEGSRT